MHASLVRVLVWSRRRHGEEGLERRVARVARQLNLWITRKRWWPHGEERNDNPQGRIPTVPLIKDAEFTAKSISTVIKRQVRGQSDGRVGSAVTREEAGGQHQTFNYQLAYPCCPFSI